MKRNSYVTTYSIDGVKHVKEHSTQDEANKFRAQLGMTREATDTTTTVYEVNGGVYTARARY